LNQRVFNRNNLTPLVFIEQHPFRSGTTMRYAHFAPSHLEDAVHCNPLAIMAQKSGGKMAAEVPAG